MFKIKCKKTPKTGIQIWVDGEYLTTFSHYQDKTDALIYQLEESDKKETVLRIDTRKQSGLILTDVIESFQNFLILDGALDLTPEDVKKNAEIFLNSL
jgi:hypothetical protein